MTCKYYANSETSTCLRPILSGSAFCAHHYEREVNRYLDVVKMSGFVYMKGDAPAI